MAVLVCGGAGYIGSHINKQLHKEGYETVVLDNLVYGHREAVFHFAAFAYVGKSVTEPEKYYYNNVANALNLLKVMKKYDCKKIIFSSTCVCGTPLF